MRTILRFAIGFAFLAILFWKVDFSEVGQALSQSLQHPYYFALAILLVFVALFIVAFRWYRMLDALDVDLGFWSCFRIFFIGQFFNTFMPGACGGDAVRAYYAVRETDGGRRAEAGATVLADRAIGLLATFMFVGVMMVYRLPALLGKTETKSAVVFIGLFLSLVLVGLVIVFRVNIFERWRILREFSENSSIGALLRRVYDALYFFRSSPVFLLEMFAYSLVNLILLAFSCQAFALSMELNVQLIDTLTYFPVLTVLASIPLTPGGLGIREYMFADLFATVGVPHASGMALSLLVYFSGIVAGIVGGLIFIGHSSAGGRRIREELEELKEQP